MAASSYQKLPGRSSTWTGPSRVWLGEDHVLLVSSRTFTETYRRFFFSDIQAIIVQRTKMGMIWNAVWGGLLGFFAIIALAVPDPTATAVLLTISAPFGVALVVNLIRGPTCKCFVRTAVQMERLPALSRLRAARKFIARIEPLIASAQGGMPSPDTVPASTAAPFPGTEANPTTGLS